MQPLQALEPTLRALGLRADRHGNLRCLLVPSIDRTGCTISSFGSIQLLFRRVQPDHSFLALEHDGAYHLASHAIRYTRDRFRWGWNADVAGLELRLRPRGAPRPIPAAHCSPGWVFRPLGLPHYGRMLGTKITQAGEPREHIIEDFIAIAIVRHPNVVPAGCGFPPHVVGQHWARHDLGRNPLRVVQPGNS